MRNNNNNHISRQHGRGKRDDCAGVVRGTRITGVDGVVVGVGYHNITNHPPRAVATSQAGLLCCNFVAIIWDISVIYISRLRTQTTARANYQLGILHDTVMVENVAMVTSR